MSLENYMLDPECNGSHSRCGGQDDRPYCAECCYAQDEPLIFVSYHQSEDEGDMSDGELLCADCLKARKGVAA